MNLFPNSNPGACAGFQNFLVWRVNDSIFSNTLLVKVTLLKINTAGINVRQLKWVRVLNSHCVIFFCLSKAVRISLLYLKTSGDQFNLIKQNANVNIWFSDIYILHFAFKDKNTLNRHNLEMFLKVPFSDLNCEIWLNCNTLNFLMCIHRRSLFFKLLVRCILLIFHKTHLQYKANIYQHGQLCKNIPNCNWVNIFSFVTERMAALLN